MTQATDYATASTLAPLLGDDLTDAEYDLSDRIAELLRRYPPERTWSPSQIAQRLHVDTNEVYPVLRWMARHLFVRTHGNASWTRYSRWMGQGYRG